MMTDHEIDDTKAKQGTTDDEPEQAEERAEDDQSEIAPAALTETDDGAALPAQLGSARYVLAGFFAAGIAIAFVVSKVITGAWNRLADNNWVASHAPFVSRIAEEDRSTYTTLLGAVVGVLAVVYAYRRPDIKTWTSEVASELAKVSWPSKKHVTNSTMVVIATGTFFTLYLGLLDRFWGFFTNLVYGS